MIVDTRPTRRIVAPMSPAVVLVYPKGSYRAHHSINQTVFQIEECTNQVLSTEYGESSDPMVIPPDVRARTDGYASGSTYTATSTPKMSHIIAKSVRCRNVIYVASSLDSCPARARMKLQKLGFS